MKRLFNISLLLIFAGLLASAEGPHLDAADATSLMAMAEAPLLPAPTPLQHMKYMVRQQVNRAIDGKPYPSISEWKPLTARQKFDVFLHSTYSPRTFANAAIDQAAD